MVHPESFAQSGFNSSETPITADDVALFLNGSRYEVLQRLARMQLFPNYLGERIGWISTWSMRGLLFDNDVRALRQSLQTAFDNAPEQYADSIEASRRLFHLAFELSERLRHAAENPITYDTIRNEFNGEIQLPPYAFEGDVFALFKFDIPASPYLQYLAEGCKEFELHNQYGCMLISKGDDTEHPITGWLANKLGATLSISTLCRDNDAAPRYILGSLLEQLLSLHLHDVRMQATPEADYTLVSTCALSALWVELRRELSEGRATICPTCGRRFVVYGKRQERRLYCDDGCKNAFIRTKRVLSNIESGLSPKDACAKVANIGLKRAASIATRNRSTFEREFPNVDFDMLAERR